MPNREHEKIICEYIRPPIPTTQFDWQATTDNYEPGCPIGNGPTRESAIIDLCEKLEIIPCRKDTGVCHTTGDCLRCAASVGESCRGDK